MLTCLVSPGPKHPDAMLTIVSDVELILKAVLQHQTRQTRCSFLQLSTTMRLFREAPTTTQRSINHGASLTSQLPAQHCKLQYRWHRVLSYPRDAQESTIKLTAAATRQALSQQLATSGTPYEVKWVVESSIHQLEPDQLALAAHRCVYTEGHHIIHDSM